MFYILEYPGGENILQKLRRRVRVMLMRIMKERNGNKYPYAII